jgi:uncharacterized protein (TIGR03086 family)
VHVSIDWGIDVSESIRRYVQAIYGLDAVVQRTSDDAWQDPSPCEGWVAVDVVVHNAWASKMVVGMVHGQPASVPQPSGVDGVRAPSDDGYVLAPEWLAAYGALTEDYSSDPIVKWNRDRDELIAALDEPGAGRVQTRSPWGETDMDSWLAFGLWDPLVHTWDLAEAVGQPTIADPGLCELALVAARTFDAKHNLRRPGVANTERSPSRTDALGRLLEFAGRNLEWRDSQH